MNDKYSLKIIQSGKTQQIRILQEGAGISGQAVVVKAADAARFQLVNVITLASPQKLELKRVGKDLHLSLPGGEVEAPDLIVEDYFVATGVSLQGRSISGEWMTYDTSTFAGNSVFVNIGLTGSSAAESVVEKVSTVSLDGSGTFLSSTWLWGGALGVTALVGGGGGGGGGGSTDKPNAAAAALATLQTYTNDTAATKTAATPTVSTYADLGIKSYASLNDTSEAGRIALTKANTNIDAINSALDKFSGAEVTKEKVQALVDSYCRILAEADGDPSKDTDVYVDAVHDADNAAKYKDPTLNDYKNIGATVANDGSLDLLNNIVGRLSATGVDTVDEINALAKAAENVILQAKAATSATADGPALYATDTEWVEGLSLLGFSGVTTAMVAAIKVAIAGTNDDGSSVDTFQKLSDVLKPEFALQVLRNYALSSSNTTPTLSTYKDAGIKGLTNLSEATASADIDGISVTAAMGTTWLAALNSALDKLTVDAATKDSIQKIANSYYRILSEADGVPNTATVGTNVDVYPGASADDPLAQDYTNIGVTVGNAKSVDLLNDCVGMSQKTAVDTVDELNAIAKAAYNVMSKAGVTDTTAASGSSVPALYSTTDNNAEWIAGLNTLLGLNTTTGVNGGTIVAVKDAITAKAGVGTAVDQVSELQYIVSLSRMQAFNDDPAAFGSKLVSTPTLDDWKAVGVKALGSLADTTANADLNSANTNLNALNSALDRLAKADFSETKLQAIANSYTRVLAEADASRSTDIDVYPSDSTTHDPLMSDYENLFGSSVNLTSLVGSTTDNHWLDLLNSCIGGMATGAVDTVGKIETLAKAAAGVMNQALGSSGWSYTQDSDWVSALTGLGISGLSGMSSADLLTVKTNITNFSDATSIDTWAELQGVVSTVRINNYAVDNTKATPGITDYQAFFTYNEINHANLPDSSNTSYLSAFNDAVNTKPSNLFTEAEIKAMVNGYVAILSEANGSTATDQTTYNPSAADYLAVGVGTGTAYDNNIRKMLGDTDSDGVINGTEQSSGFATLLTDVVANKNSGDVDTVLELNNLAKIVLKVQELSAKTDVIVGSSANSYAPNDSSYSALIDGGRLQVEELTNLGLNTGLLTYNSNGALSQTVYTHRVNNVYDNIINSDAAHLNSLAQIQQIINNTSGIIV